MYAVKDRDSMGESWAETGEAGAEPRGAQWAWWVRPVFTLITKKGSPD